MSTPFDCQICLATAHPPSVTPCGHLFCSGCMSKWYWKMSNESCPSCYRKIRAEEIYVIAGMEGADTKEYVPPDHTPGPSSDNRNTTNSNLSLDYLRGVDSPLNRLINISLLGFYVIIWKSPMGMSVVVPGPLNKKDTIAFGLITFACLLFYYMGYS